MHRGYTIQLYPNKAQQQMLRQNFGCVRWVYNHMITIQQKRYHRTGKGMSGYDLQNMLPKLKKQYPWLCDANSQTLQITCHDLAGAYTKFFKKKGGYPKFKKKNGNGSFTCINDSRIEEKHIRIPKVGMIRFRGGDMPDGKPKRFTISERAGKFFASILFDDGVLEPEAKNPKTITGLDLGLNDSVVTSIGQIFPAPRFMRKASKRVKRIQRELSRCQKGSRRRAKKRIELARAHMKVSNQRKEYQHQITCQLVSDSKNQAFGIENLAVRNMMKNHCLAGAISDAAWYQFRAFLEYKARAVGKQVFVVDRFYPSSKTCSACGLVCESIPLSVREWTCSCGAKHHRDVNAAVNIANEAARNAVRGGSGRPIARQAAPVEAQSSTSW